MHSDKPLKSILVSLCVLLSSMGSAAVSAQSTADPIALPAPETLPPVRRDTGSVIGGAMPQSGQAVVVTASGSVWLAGGSGGLVRSQVEHTSILFGACQCRRHRAGACVQPWRQRHLPGACRAS